MSTKIWPGTENICFKILSRVLLFSLLLSISGKLYAQEIKMNFPHFAGKTYDFIIFQGDKPVVHKDTIPSNGKFTLNIPPQCMPYTGMSRWLITNTLEGGGLDMLIHGKDFSVTCLEVIPNSNNIIYTGNDLPALINKLYNEQQIIIDRFGLMANALKLYSKNDKAHKTLIKEYNNQITAYAAFQKNLKDQEHYLAQLIQIINVTQGIGTQLGLDDIGRAKNIANWISNDMDWEALYTSGHWSGIISAWADIHTMVLKDTQMRDNAIESITSNLRPKLLQAFKEAAGRKGIAISR